MIPLRHNQVLWYSRKHSFHPARTQPSFRRTVNHVALVSLVRPVVPGETKANRGKGNSSDAREWLKMGRRGGGPQEDENAFPLRRVVAVDRWQGKPGEAELSRLLISRFAWPHVSDAVVVS